MVIYGCLYLSNNSTDIILLNISEIIFRLSFVIWEIISDVIIPLISGFFNIGSIIFPKKKLILKIYIFKSVNLFPDTLLNFLNNNILINFEIYLIILGEEIKLSFILLIILETILVIIL